MNKEIEYILVRWCKEMVNKYNWLTIKYEFSSSYGVYLVSFSPISEITESEEFNVEVMRFEDEMNSQYGNNAPLFCDEERNFKLTDNAVILGAEANAYVTVRLNSVQMTCTQTETKESFSEEGYVISNTFNNTIIIAA